ncbi:MAG: hypothetical protein IT374_26420 [Polyangiaceae bacterium]|nr:hypothetical protein [Polyangiaceae bacterium]
MADLLEQLRRTRSDYLASVVADRFALDSYTGGGGFAGRIRPADPGPFGSIGSTTTRQTSAAYQPPTDDETYLDRFPRETPKKFDGRKQVAHYPGYVRTLTDLKLSFLLRKPFDRAGDDAWADWYDDTDGAGTTWRELLPSIVLRAAVLGWCPCLVDAPRGPSGGGTISTAQARAAGIASPRLIPLFPANIVDWQLGTDGQLDWVKIRTDSHERDSWRDELTPVETYTVWTRTVWSRWTVRTRDGNASASEDEAGVPHSWGRVPLAILRHSPSPDDALRGIPMHADVAILARRLFNLLSERDESLRGQVFALLTQAQDFKGSVPDPTRAAAGTTAPIGTTNVIEYHHEWPAPAFIAPPASVIATYNDVITATVTELYRLARAEFSRGVASATSGVARAYEFAQTNRAIHDFALQVSRWWEDVLDLTGITLGLGDTVRDGARITPPESFDVEDLQGEIDQATAALALSLGVTAETEIKRRLVGRLLSNLDDETRGEIDEDLEDAAAAKLEQQASAVKLAQANAEAAARPSPFGRPGNRPGNPPVNQAGNTPPNGQPAAPPA